ncbi:MAG: protein kinase [Polyangiaceae bacterium]|nr:protein kinase [Polyangiaceae bacterium]
MNDNAKPEGTLQVAVGDVVACKYRVERVLGQGAMGVVVAARHEDLGQKVAIKLLHPDVSASDDGRERFLREARAAAKLESDHVVRVFDVGTFGDKHAYMVMEHLEGSDLERYLDGRGPLDIEEAVDYVMEALEALAHAHAHGMVHRDIKPSNLFLTQRVDGTRRVKILDFGISKTDAGLGVSSPGSSTLTSPHAVLGSPAYMAPEQIRSSKTVDQTADIWSVGVMLYELTSGKSPFLGESVGDTLARVLMGNVEPLSVVRRDAPKELSDVVARCLEMDEKKRFQNVAELAVALAPLGSSRTKELPERIARVLGADMTARGHRAIGPLDRNGGVDVSAETIAAPAKSTANGTQITATSTGSTHGLTRSSRTYLGVAAATACGVAIMLFMTMRPGSDGRPQSTREHVPVAMESVQQPAPTPVASPKIVPVGVPDAPTPTPHASAAMPLPSASATMAPVHTISSSKQMTQPVSSQSKKTPAKTPTPGYPAGLLDGRD